MAIVKVLGMETEYGIIIRGSPDPNPIAASSTLINAYVAELARKVAWDFEDETPGQGRPGLRPGRLDAARGGDPPGQRRAHQRRPLLRRPRPPRVLDSRVRQRPRRRPLRQGRRAHPGPLDRRRGPDPATGPEHRGAEEQLRRQGQLVRHPRELPDGPGRALRPDRPVRHAALRLPPDLHRGRQGRYRGVVAPAGST